jgi:hypothetical protein
MAETNELVKRVAELERQVRDLRQAVEDSRDGKNWRRTVGMFAGDEVMREIIEEGQKIREADRERARRAAMRAENRKSSRVAAAVERRKKK